MNSSHILALLKWDDDVISKNSKIRRFGLSGSLLQYTVFENHPKCRIQHCERSEHRVHFE